MCQSRDFPTKTCCNTIILLSFQYFLLLGSLLHFFWYTTVVCLVFVIAYSYTRVTGCGACYSARTGSLIPHGSLLLFLLMQPQYICTVIPQLCYTHMWPIRVLEYLESAYQGVCHYFIFSLCYHYEYHNSLNISRGKFFQG